MSILGFIILAIIAAIAGAIGQSLAGFHLGGCSSVGSGRLYRGIHWHVFGT